jgi:hypothetical protein
VPDTAPQHDATAILQRLFRVPPPEFVAERNKIAKALKADGEADLAVAVSAVRRPGVSDWALDVAAAEHADDVAELVEAANEVLDAQEAAMDGRDGGDLRIRLKLLRVCAATVANQASGIATQAGQTGGGSSVTDITTRLTEIAANRNALSLLQRGLLGAEDPGVADPFGIADAPSSPAAAAKSPAKSKAAAAPPAPAKPAGRSAAELKKLQAAVADAKKALAAAQAASTAADKALAKQEAIVAKAEARVVEAEQLVEARRDDVREAKGELDDLWDRRDAAASDVSRAQAALDAADAALAG